MTRPLVILSLGAGVQSSTLALAAAAGEFGLLTPDAAIFADTQDEPAAVYEWLAWLDARLTYPLLYVTAGSLSADAVTVHVNQKTGKPYYSNRIPAFVKSAGKSEAGKVSRHCTRDFKIYPIERKVRQLVGAARLRAWRKKHRDSLRLIAAHEREKRAARREGRGCRTVRPHEAWATVQADALVVQWIGISRDEIERAKPSRVPWIRHEWPLIFGDAAMRRADCLRWMERRGFPTPPRSACIYCPYKSNAEWRRLRDESPVEFEAAAVFEANLQAAHAGVTTPGKLQGTPFLHRSLVPLRDVDLSTEAERGQGDLFGGECEGMCGV